MFEGEMLEAWDISELEPEDQASVVGVVRRRDCEALLNQIEKLRCSGGRAEFQAELDKLYALANPKPQA